MNVHYPCSVLFTAFCIASTANAGTILGSAIWDTGNGHEYVAVELFGSTWTEAANDVMSELPGFHLATITSQEEQNFIDGLLDDAGISGQLWIGGFQNAAKPEVDPAADWQWITGEPWNYTNWRPSEPNDGGGIEDHNTLDSRQWNDEGTAIGSVRGYMAESIQLGVLGRPTGIEFGPDGDLFVSSAATDEVLRYDGTTGDFIDVFASGGGLSRPEGVSFGPDGHLYVSSFNGNQVLRYDGTTGEFIDVFTVPEPSTALLLGISFIATIAHFTADKNCGRRAPQG